jgi:hypothetical protein
MQMAKSIMFISDFSLTTTGAVSTEPSGGK